MDILDLIIYREHIGVGFYVYFLNGFVLVVAMSLSLITVSLGNIFYSTESAIQERSPPLFK